MKAPCVTVISTLRDEPIQRVRRMVDAIAAQVDTPRLELVLAAPRNEHEALRSIPASGAVSSLLVVDNPTGQRSPGLNAAVGAATHPVCCRVDARSILPPTYVARSAALVASDDAIGIVGGIQVPFAQAGGTVARGIARGLANPVALGGARYRRVDRSGPADTAYLGTFRRESFLAVGGYDERLDANEDFDLSARYRQAGYSVFVLGTPVLYESRETFAELFRQYEAFGRAKARYWKLTGERPNRRQSLAISAAASGAVTAAALMLHRRGGVPPVALAAAGALALVDQVGAGGGRLPERLASCATYPTVYTAWLTGIASELLKVRL